MVKVEKYEKLNKPGLWFVCSEQPATELKQYVYDFAVESGLPIVVYSDIPKKEIQNAVIDRIKTKYIENATDEKVRNWLEQEMMEYNNHGSFWYNYVYFDEFEILSFTNCFSNLYLINNLSKLYIGDGHDMSHTLLSIEQEAVEYKKTIIVFVSPNDSYYDSTRDF